MAAVRHEPIRCHVVLGHRPVRSSGDDFCSPSQLRPVASGDGLRLMAAKSRYDGRGPTGFNYDRIQNLP